MKLDIGDLIKRPREMAQAAFGKDKPMRLDVAALKKRLQARSTLAITLESKKTVVELLRLEDEGIRVLQSLTLSFGADEAVANPAKAAQELAAQLAAAGIRERRCVVCIPPRWALTTSTETPDLGGEDLRGFLELRAEREFPIAINDLRLAHCSYTLPDGSRRATLAAVTNKRIDAIAKMLEAAGCRAVSISLGLEACLPGAESPAALNFLANGNHVDVVIAAGGGIVALRSLSGTVAPGSGFDAAGFSREVRITLGGLPGELRRQIREARFYGPPETARNLCQEIRGQLDAMGVQSHMPDELGGVEVVAQVAADRHLRQKPVVFEFVTPQVNKWQANFARFDSQGRRKMVGAALGLLLLPVIIFFVRSRMESRLSSEWEGMRRNVADLEIVQQKIRQFRPWFEPSPQNLEAWEALAGAFPEQGEVWAKNAQINENFKVTCSGFARTQPALLAMLDRLRARPEVKNLQVQQLRGQNPLQFSVTYKWEARDAK